MLSSDINSVFGGNRFGDGKKRNGSGILRPLQQGCIQNVDFIPFHYFDDGRIWRFSLYVLVDEL